MKTLVTYNVKTNLDNYLLLINRDGQVEYASDALLECTGICDKKELIKVCFEGNENKEAVVSKSEILKLFTDPECTLSYSFEKKLTTAKAETKWFEWTIRAQSNSNLVVQGTDITKYKIKEEELIREKIILEELVNEKSRNFDRLRQNAKRIKEIIEDIGDSLCEDVIARKIYTNLKEIIPLDSFYLFHLNPQNENFECNNAYFRNKKLPVFKIPVQEASAELLECSRIKETVISGACDSFVSKILQQSIKEKNAEKLIDLLNEKACTQMFLPVFTKEKLSSVLLFQSFRKNAFSDFQIEVVSNIGFSIGMILENASLYSGLEEKVKARTKEVELQKSMLESSNKSITESIQYAKKIQRAMLAPEEGLQKLIGESFLLYKPKDIVSGDFYWYYKSNDKIFLAAIDCTGHGVPGALMSVIGNSIFRDVIIKRKIENAETILSTIDRELDLFLNKEGTGSKTADGMDVALVVYDEHKKEIQFSGAFRPLLRVRGGEVSEFRGNRFPIGFYQAEEKKFESHTIKIQEGDCYYIFSDGYLDQFGGEKGKKLNRRRFNELLLCVEEMNMEEQKSFLEYAFTNWKQEEEQTDDVLVIGFRT